MKNINQKEKLLAKNLSPQKAEEFILTRGYARHLLGDLFDVPAMEVPLRALPGSPPLIAKEWGNISFSHCEDAILIGWCKEKIGVDIERSDRNFKAEKIISRFYNDQEKLDLKKLSPHLKGSQALKLWVLKESAIKLKNGNLAIDLSKWIIKNSLTNAYHEKLKIEIDTRFFKYKSWFIGIALNDIGFLEEEIEIHEI